MLSQLVCVSPLHPKPKVVPCCLVPSPDVLKACTRSILFFYAALVAGDQCLLWFSTTEALEVNE